MNSDSVVIFRVNPGNRPAHADRPGVARPDAGLRNVSAHIKQWLEPMRDRGQIVGAFESLCAAGEPAALATVVAVEGSSYRRPGARMLIATDGRTWGTVSGGCLEHDVARRARILIGNPDKPLLICYETDEEESGEENAWPVVDPGPSLGCGGRIEVLIQRVTAADPAAIAALSAVVRQRACAIVATVVRVGCAPDDAVRPGSQLLRLGEAEPLGQISDPHLHEVLRHQLLAFAPADQKYSPHRHTLSRGGWADVLAEWLQPAQAGNLRRRSRRDAAG